MSHVLVAGAGWLGLPLSAELVAKGYDVTATRRSESGLSAVSGVGALPLLVDLEQEIPPLPRCDVMVLCLPPGRQADALPFHERLAPLLDAAVEAGIAKVIFTSATSVYGQLRGRVDESVQVDEGERAARMLKVEQAVRQKFPRVTILRLSGLVGGARHPGRFLAGKRELPGGDDPVNLVHREDVIAAILALLRADHWGETFNLVSPHHPSRRRYYGFCTDRLGLAPPEFEAGFHQPRWVEGQRICQRLGWRYRYTNLYVLPELIR
ncbi:SDR family NAD(P)-dependent oxidoreductase [Ferrimonas sediminicola]|uniref:SDR family NAD(P)-dependent oxidoreductase n=1 Tax=Ferrimonas sediminicola TaxID=2569538 RepID=A0A4V5NXE3_9GAMM|nr:NAD(P)H-binding protein [Ferrimonas sediminicola]TKB50653.1 SDR family NAD(P)-dependent oxidoreductase [Ferrimonas sediminicola]